MTRSSYTRFFGIVAILALFGSITARQSFAYVDLAPTLTKILGDAKRIIVVEVVEFDRDKHVIEFKEIKALKGELSNEKIRHVVASSTNGTVPMQINQWAEPGARAVLFGSRNAALVCVGQGWYAVRLSAATNNWQLGADRPDLPLAYYGPVSKLADGIENVLAGKDAIITAVSYGAEDVQTSIDLALNRTNLPAIVKVQRLRVNSKMPAMVMASAASSAYVVGQGPVDKADLPALQKGLDSADATVRAESAGDLAWLGKSAAPASDRLNKLLTDSAPRVRLNAAVALLRIDSHHAGAIKVLTEGLANKDAAVRRNTAQAVGFAGRGAGELTPKLVELLADSDSAVQVAALQAITTLGPAAAKAVPALKKLLENEHVAIDAADALGRIGQASRPIPESLTKMLSSDQKAVQWAAVRAISQIGGEEAAPGVKFMMEVLPTAAHVDQYNLIVYFALLGRDAREALPTIRDLRAQMNPMLKPATLWAIDPDANFPWNVNMMMGFGGFRGPPNATPPAASGETAKGPAEGGAPPGGNAGGPGNPGGGMVGPPGGRMGGPPGGMGGDGPDLARYIFESYFIELGDRLTPSVCKLANAILEGKEGNIPSWGYKLLGCAPDEALKILAPKLADKELVQRERAAVALGYMGPFAIAARDQVRSAVASATNDQEKRLMEWCLREIETPED